MRYQHATISFQVSECLPDDVNAGCFQLSHALVCVLKLGFVVSHCHAHTQSLLFCFSEQALDSFIVSKGFLRFVAFGSQAAYRSQSRVAVAISCQLELTVSF